MKRVVYAVQNLPRLTGVGVGGFGVGVASVYYTFLSNKREKEASQHAREAYQQTLPSFQHELAQKTLSSTYGGHSNTTALPVDYIPRPTTEEWLQDRLQKYNSEWLCLIGPRGSGKSTLLEKVLSGRKGVINVEITSVMTAEESLNAIVRKIGANPDYCGDVKSFLVEAFDRFYENTGVQPVLLLSSHNLGERPPDPRLVAKGFVDRASRVRVIIDVSSTTHYLNVTDDPRSVAIPFPHDFTFEQTKSFLMRYPGLDVSKVYSLIGGRPIGLRSVVQGTDPEVLVLNAGEAIARCIVNDKAAKAFLRKLASVPYEDGLSDLSDTARLMAIDKCRSILRRSNFKSQFHSKSVHSAAQLLEV